jgi:hypothetical protein
MLEACSNNAVNHVHEVIKIFDSLNFLYIHLFDLQKQQQQSSPKARLRWNLEEIEM